MTVWSSPSDGRLFNPDDGKQRKTFSLNILIFLALYIEYILQSEHYGQIQNCSCTSTAKIPLLIAFITQMVVLCIEEATLLRKQKRKSILTHI